MTLAITSPSTSATRASRAKSARPHPAVHLLDWANLESVVPTASVDLLYADPPFNTGLRRSGRAGAYTDSFGSLDRYIAWLRPRIAASIRTLKPTGSLLLHVDWRTAHRVRVLLDELLGEDRFVNHLIWSYGLGGSSPRRFARKHDDILWYALNPALYHFTPPRTPATSARMRGQTKKMTDILLVPSINNMAAERTGYPTQKPLALLRLLINACCPPRGTVCDPCCGSGTTLLAALTSGRVPIGCDTNPRAVALAAKRLAAASRSAPPE